MRALDLTFFDQSAAALSHLKEAAELARHTGERCLGEFWFGPTNVGIWHLTVRGNLGEGPGELAQEIRPDILDSKNRQAGYYAALGHALAQSRKDDTAAVAAFIRAESLAPQFVRSNMGGRRTIRRLLHRARSGSSREIRHWPNGSGWSAELPTLRCQADIAVSASRSMYAKDFHDTPIKVNAAHPDAAALGEPLAPSPTSRYIAIFTDRRRQA